MNIGLSATAGVVAFLVSIVAARAQTDFYAGKQISLLIGTTPGGGYDAYGRLLARHIGRHIPGNPAVIAKNMPPT
jgi:tripartite-type tricarboxylate transporter receptor subunit TctC